HFGEAFGATDVAVEPPPVGPGGETHQPQPVHGFDELLVVVLVDHPGRHHHHRAALDGLGVVRQVLVDGELGCSQLVEVGDLEHGSDDSQPDGGHRDGGDGVAGADDI